jgi:hypothetical protein
MADSWDTVMAGSCMPEGVPVGNRVCQNAVATAFYDIGALYCCDRAIERIDDRDIVSSHSRKAKYCV